MRYAALRQALAGEHRLCVQLADLRLVEWVVTRGPPGDERQVLFEELLLLLLVELQRCVPGR